jgi:3-oxoadipate enol-lactonase
MRRLKIGDRLVRVRDEGEGKKPPLVFVHGAGSSSVVWMDAVRRLHPRRRVVAPDLPGHGQSAKWHDDRHDDVSVAMYRDAVGTVCATLKLDKVVLVGHSMGGQIALACAAAWPERVAALVLIGCGDPMTVSPRTWDVLRSDFAHANEWLARVAWSPSTPRELVEKWQSLVLTADRETTLADFGAVDRFSAEKLAAQVKCPTLLLSGADDLLCPPHLVTALGRQIPGAGVVLPPRAGHMLPLELPDVFHAELDRFLG